jgi:hypothetical protein
VATCLTQLEQLVIVNCEVLEEIVAEEEAEQAIARFVFPRLTVLHLVIYQDSSGFTQECILQNGQS